jgi:hypothetical protein
MPYKIQDVHTCKELNLHKLVTGDAVRQLGLAK